MKEQYSCEKDLLLAVLMEGYSLPRTSFFQILYSFKYIRKVYIWIVGLYCI
jgi:hypothetical protein